MTTVSYVGASSCPAGTSVEYQRRDNYNGYATIGTTSYDYWNSAGTYTYWAHARCDGPNAQSAWSGETSGSINILNPPVPAAVGGFSSSSDYLMTCTTHQMIMSLSWSGASGATSYNIQYQYTDFTANVVTNSASSGAPSFGTQTTDNSSSPNPLARVQSVNAYGVSAWSPWITIAHGGAGCIPG